jgi:hypothetical protein
MVPSPPKQNARISQIRHTINLELNMLKRPAEVSMTTNAITWVRREFRIARATLNWNASKLEESRIDASSANTGGLRRNEHLRSDTFKGVYTRLAQSPEASPAVLTATGFSVAYSLRKGI